MLKGTMFLVDDIYLNNIVDDENKHIFDIDYWNYILVGNPDDYNVVKERVIDLINNLVTLILDLFSSNSRIEYKCSKIKKLALQLGMKEVVGLINFYLDYYNSYNQAEFESFIIQLDAMLSRALEVLTVDQVVV